MGKLRVLSGREVCEILEAQGFFAVRQRGSHVVTVPQATPLEFFGDHAKSIPMTLAITSGFMPLFRQQ